MKKLIFTFFLIFILPNFLLSQDEIEINKEFSLFTSDNAQSYLKPLVTTVGESFNTNLYTSGFYSNQWSFGVDLSLMGMFIPQSHKNYDAILPDQYGNTNVVKTADLRNGVLRKDIGGTVKEPTIYGGMSHPVFAAPQNNFPPDSFYKSVTYAEGNNISFMPGIPALQLVGGFPTRTQIRFRFFYYPIQNGNLNYYMIALNQNIDKLFDLFDYEDNMDWALNASFNKLSRDPGLDLTTWSVGTHFSKGYGENFTLYTGLQYESLSGSFFAVKKDFHESDVLNSPYQEVREGQPLDFELESFANIRLLGGASYKWGPAEFHADVAYAAQPVVSAGVTMWIFENRDKAEVKYPEYRDVPLKEPDVIAYNMPDYQNKVYDAKRLEKPVKREIIPDLSASTEVFALVDSVEQPLQSVKVEEFELSEMRALLPYVFFEHNTDTLPSRYKLYTEENVNQFSKEQLLGQETLGNYYHVLNIIADRMKQYDAATITITGCNSNKGEERGNTQLSRNRAEFVKNYFTQVWNIQEQRITVEARNLPSNPSNTSTEDGTAENRRVEIDSDLWEITAPIMLKDTFRIAEPEIVKFRNHAKSEAGLQSWELNVYEKGNPLKTYSGGKALDSTNTWNINEDENAKAAIRENMYFSLEVTDTTDQFYTTSMKEIPVYFTSVMEKKAEKEQDTLFNRYNLILFEFDSANMGTDNRRIVDVIKKDLKFNSDVLIRGYTDRIGDFDYNKRLAKRRTESTAKAINHDDTESIAVGEESLLYDNSTPEGRFYCRTVVVDVKTPTKNEGEE